MPSRAAIETCQYGAESLADFIARLSPQFAPIPWHLQRVVEVVQQTRDREVFATVSMPPRHGKTVTLAHGLAWRSLYDPACLNFYATSGDDLAQSTSRLVRRLVREAGMPLSDEAQNVHDWRTIFDGGLRATSTGGSVIGKGCNSGLIVADDLIKNRELAESKHHRDRVWDWFRDDMMTRRERGASIIVNATRWHEDDVIGRIKRDPMGLPWIHVELPAVYGLDGQATDEREDPNAKPLWPEGGYTMARYAEDRLRGEHGWWSLYQQRPYPKGGGMFKREWFQIVDAAPAEGKSVRGWDLAASTEGDAAQTAGTRMKIVRGKIYIEDCRAIRGNAHAVESLIMTCAQQDGRGVDIDIPQDPGQAGKAQKSYLASRLGGNVVHFSLETGSKELRAEPLAAQAQAGNVYLVRGHWNADFLDEVESFPTGRYKDRVDASSRAYARLVNAERAIDPGVPPILIRMEG